MEEEYDLLKQKIEDLYNSVDAGGYDEDEAEKLYYELEEQLNEFERDYHSDFDFDEIKAKMKAVKRDLNLYDEEAELNSMFPNGRDDDEDSGESFFRD